MAADFRAKPFLKWAGGKTQLLDTIDQFLPQDLRKGNLQRYIEPFVGGGAVFFYIAQTYKLDDLFIFDINPDLILAYQTIKTQVDELTDYLFKLQTFYLNLDEEKRKGYYYQVRSNFNRQRQQIDFQNYSEQWLERVKQLIFLNRTCFNGLYRVNSKGEFNVPMGKYKNPKICDATNLKAVAKVLQKTQIELGDYTICEQFANQNSFVYFDPPYRPISRTANFNAYADLQFDDREQVRLRDFVQRLNRKGVKVMLSNSDPKNEDQTDNFFESAYQGFNVQRVKAVRNINSKGNKRGKINEILVTNYPNP